MTMTTTRIFGLGLVGSSLLLAACGGAGSKATGLNAQVGAQAAAGPKCARRAPGVGAARVDDARESNAVALAKLGDKTIAYVADDDDSVLHTVDVSSGREISTTPLAGSPSQVLVAKDGRVVVSLRDKNRVQVLEPTAQADKPLDNLCAIDVAAEPIALAATPDDSTILVTSGWGRTLTALDEEEMRVRYRVALAREPRSIVVSDDGSKAYVAHVVGSRLSSVDLRAPEHPVRTVDMTGEDPNLFRRGRGVAGLLKGPQKQERMGCQSFALAKSMDPPGRVFAPQVLVDPGDGEQATSGYGDGFRPAEVASIGVIDEGTSEPLDSSLKLRPNEQNVSATNQKECLLPRSAATDPTHQSLFVTCMGIDSLVEYDAASADPRTAERRRWSVGAGPTGIAIDRTGQRAVVWSQFDQSIALVSLTDDAKSKPTMIALSRKAKTAVEGDVTLGRKLFHTSGDPRISSDGRACASCHPDGRDDSLTWATPDGPRNTPMLAGRVGNHPGGFGWLGSSDTVETHLTQTFQRLRGRGLETSEVAALEAYLTTMRAPAAPVPMLGPEGDRVAHGKAVFESAETGCASCHKTDGTLADGDRHDVMSSAKADRDGKFETPSLRFVAGTAPYFHDGRFRTLRELLVGSDDRMGHTKQLSPEDLDALEAYMRTL
jgi:DNA-binding beta-propeller fold protein YncE